MISFGWLFVAFFFGCGFGIGLIAIVSANRDD